MIPGVLRVGTDCSGIEAPIQALKLLNVPFHHVFSSEIDQHCINSIKSNYSPDIIFGDKSGQFPDGDITKRNIDNVPDIDLYVCGFPCQPFSVAGKKQGLNDPRGTIFWSCLDVIKQKSPKYFILENVKGLLTHDDGNTWSVIWSELTMLEKHGYNIKYKILNTRDYGIPQNRERLYIVGVKDDDFDWPEPIEIDDIKYYIDADDTRRQPIPEFAKEFLGRINQRSIFVSMGFRQKTYANAHQYCGCITCSDADKLWNVPMHRQANVKEFLRLQGFSDDFVYSNPRRLKMQLGNSMSTNVLVAIFTSILII